MNEMQDSQEIKSHQNNLPLPINEVQITLAQKFPRDPAMCIKNALAELEAFPEVAARSYYSIPFKKHKYGCKNRSSCDCPKEYVEDPSIGGMLSIANHWRNNVNASRIAEEREDRIIVEGFYFDYEANNLRIRTIEVSRFEKGRSGNVYRLDEDRLHKAIQAGMSKAIRNAIKSGLPSGAINMYFEMSKKIASEYSGGKKSTISPKQRIQEARAWFRKKYNATDEEMDILIRDYISENDGRPTDQDIVGYLKGIGNALVDKQTTPEDIFNRKAENKSLPQEKK